MRGDDGFEDREGHQAPFTLPIADRGLRIAERKENPEHRTSNAERRIAEADRYWLLDLFDRLDDGVEIRPVAGVEFGMEKFVIGANLESAAARWDERERLNAFAELKNFGRQTDGLRRVISNYAVFDRYFGFQLKLSFPRMKLSARSNAVKTL